MQVGHDFFRVHPKGVGLICLRPEGLPPLTFVEEYLGEMHAPWRWFEIQVHLVPAVLLCFVMRLALSLLNVLSKCSASMISYLVWDRQNQNSVLGLQSQCSWTTIEC